MPRFQLEIWDRQGFVKEAILDNAMNTKVSHALNAEHTLSFTFPLSDTKYSFANLEKTVRLADNEINTYPTTILHAPALLNQISVYDGSNYNIGDFLLFYDRPLLDVSSRVTVAITADMSSSQVVSVSNTTNISVGDYLRIEDNNNAEIVKVLAVSAGVSFTAYVTKSFLVDASVTTPGRSIIAKILTARKATGKVTQNNETAGSDVVIELNTTTGIVVGDYIRIYDDVNSEHCYVSAVNAGTSITVSTLANNYNLGSTVDNYTFGLSRRDFQPDADAKVELVNFTTFRINQIEENRSSGIPAATIICNHIGYDLNHQCYLENGRGDISYKEQGSGQILSDAADLDSLVDAALNRQADSLGNPLAEANFFKGDLYSFRYSTGTISVTNGDATVTGSGVDWDNITSGTMAVEGDDTVYTISEVTASTTLELTATVDRETESGLKYLIIASGIQTYQSDVICTGDVRQISDNQIDNISADMVDGNIRAGAIVRIEGDLNWYYIKDIVDTDTAILTSDVVRSADTSLNMLITRDEREIEFTEATPLRGVLNQAGEIWSDHTQAVWYEIDEDKSINIVRKIIPDDRDPTSDLVVRYSRSDWVTNLEAVKRKYEQKEFANVVLAVGAKSGWINASTKITSDVVTDTNNRTTSFKVTSGDNKKFRAGDPIQLLREPNTVTITSATNKSASITSATQYDQYNDGMAFTDDTTEATNSAVDDVVILPGPPTVNDARYFGSGARYSRILANISTVGQAPTSSDLNWGVTWEYYNGASWAELSFSTQQMDNFYNSMYDAGTYINYFFVPSNWATISVNGQSAYWIRARVSSVTTSNDNSGVNDKANSMVDTTQNLNGATGMTIYNLTDGSSGTVTSVTTTTNPNDTLNFAGGLSGGTYDEFDDGDEYFVWTQPLGAQLWHNNFIVNEFAGGLITIFSGEGEGQVRYIPDNSATTINVSRKWDKLPITATAVITRDIGNTVVRGCGYEKLAPEATTTATYVDVYDVDDAILIDYAYRGGILNVVDGPGSGQSYEIAYNTVGDYDSDTNSDDIRFYLNGTFDSIPSIYSVIEVIAPTQLSEEYTSGTTFTASTAVFTPADHGFPTTVDDLWNTGTVYVTNGDDSGNSYTIDDTAVAAGVVTITISGTFGTTPSAGDAILLIKSHDLPLSVASGLRFNPAAGDKGVLLLKHTGGGLSIGKHYEYRSSVSSATQTSITLDDATNFEENQTVLVGAKTITNSLAFNMRKGDQAMGEVAIIASKSGNTIEFNGTLNPVPKPGDQVEILTLVNNGSINAYGVRETAMTAQDMTNPRELYHDAQKFLDEISDTIPRYLVDFLHLHELDPETWKFDNYNIGDTIRVVDDDIGIDEDDLRIVKEEYNPNFPADVKVEIAKRMPTETIGRAASLDIRVAQIEDKLAIDQQMLAAPRCVYWDDEHKGCSRIDQPNTFCHTEESNFDGRLTAEKQAISKTLCERFTPDNSLNTGTDEGAIITARDFKIEDIDNTTYNWTKVAEISLDNEVMRNSWATVTGAWEDVGGSKVKEELVDVRIGIHDVTDSVVPLNEGAWSGCYVQAKLASGSTSITAVGTAFIVRRRH